MIPDQIHDSVGEDQNIITMFRKICFVPYTCFKSRLPPAAAQLWCCRGRTWSPPGARWSSRLLTRRARGRERRYWLGVGGGVGVGLGVGVGVKVVVEVEVGCCIWFWSGA